MDRVDTALWKPSRESSVEILPMKTINEQKNMCLGFGVHILHELNSIKKCYEEAIAGLMKIFIL